jgi:acetyl esterase/lipase
MWRKYIPAGTGPFPTVLVVHGVGFHAGSPMDNGVEKVSRDLQSSGFLALAVTYRLAQCGRITGQDPNYQDPLSGRPPEQTDDIKSLIRAARLSLPTLCNGNVGVLGGSAGASHAVFVSLDKTASPPNTYPNWCQNGNDDRPLCAVGLSGAYDFSDRLPPGYEDLLVFIRDMQNYTNSCVLADQKSVSPVAKVQPESQQTFKPIYVINSENDSMPWHQIEDLRCTLVGAQINSDLYTVKTISGMDHSFNLWLDQVSPPSPTKVRDEVIAFLTDHVMNPP